MANLATWGRSSMRALQDDIDDLMEEFTAPRSMRREIERLFDDDDVSPRALMRDMDRLFDEFTAPVTFRQRMSTLLQDLGGWRIPLLSKTEEFAPQVELKELDAEFVLKADLPGVREQDVDVRISDDNILTVGGERREEETKHAKGYEYSERSYGSFSRSIELPAAIDASKIKASFDRGVLEVHVPKTEAAQTRRIPIGREEPKVLGAASGPTVQPSQAHS